MKEEKKSSRTMTSWRKHVCGAVACINTENPKRKQLQMKYSNDGKQWSLGLLLQYSTTELCLHAATKQDHLSEVSAKTDHQ